MPLLIHRNRLFLISERRLFHRSNRRPITTATIILPNPSTAIIIITAVTVTLLHCRHSTLRRLSPRRKTTELMMKMKMKKVSSNPAAALQGIQRVLAIRATTIIQVHRRKKNNSNSSSIMLISALRSSQLMKSSTLSMKVSSNCSIC